MRASSKDSQRGGAKMQTRDPSRRVGRLPAAQGSAYAAPTGYEGSIGRVSGAMDQKLELLKRTPLLAGLSQHDIEEVGRLADEVDPKAGKVLMREGEPGREFF